MVQRHTPSDHFSEKIHLGATAACISCMSLPMRKENRTYGYTIHQNISSNSLVFYVGLPYASFGIQIA